MMPRSIRGRLALLVLASIALVWTIALGWSYRQATREVAEWDDARLVQLAQFIVLLDQADLSVLANTRIDARTEYSRHPNGATATDGDEAPREALFQVRDRDGCVLASSARLASLGAFELPADATPGAHIVTLGGQPWHSYILQDSTTGRTARVLEPPNSRSDLTTGVAGRIAKPIAVALPVLALLVWISIGHSLAPLQALSKAIRARDASKLEPIEIGPTPVEVRPLVDAINQLLLRLRLSIDRERAFTADAAHELRTPLAAIKVQAQVALVAQDAAQQQLAMQRVVQGVDRSAHLAEQLLLLARLDEHRTIPGHLVALAALAQDAIAANEPNARRKGMSVALIGDAHSEVIAEPVLMDILLDNLIDNAIKYGDAGGRVEVTIRRNAQAVMLTVADNGPGVAPGDIARLTGRFFRVTGNGASGSGLGLSIVARIAEYFGAKVDFSAGINDRGLAVHVSFPVPAVESVRIARSSGI
ncbi:ATP-binding protein [Paraburkholderia phenazinium]|uniref:histidine kinase n=1 Tax=Paraburkholderia phenazinium TaxID=60549 RepID=A0A1G8PB81_9BURK|nr:ATP-binding protein [Paraburkholderia phenazinium]SDI89732.1 two-component system, OmpR family, sensor histidine kinase QseC [Paraburkholderia phenazinium]